MFGAPYAYAQPHSGIDANLVAYWAILTTRVEAAGLAEAGAKHINDLSEADWEALRNRLGNQRLMGMSLDAGGHLTHGFRPNISGKMFHRAATASTLKPDCSTMTRSPRPAREFKPLILIAGYSAYPRRINFAKMREIADEVDATLMVDMAHFAGLVAGKVFTGDEDPVPHAHVTTTTTHKSLRGPRGAADPGAAGVRRRRRQGLSHGAGWTAGARHGRQGGRAGRGPPARHSQRLRRARRR